jgi:prepilin-type N-terminal cleavage/methylation domain-containing protein
MRARGFTLLEMLVVLALLALVTGLVAPAMVRNLAAARERGVESDLRALLAQWPVQAFEKGEAIEVDEAALRARVDLPEGWRIELPQPLRYTADGVASGGTVRLVDGRRQVVDLRVAAVTGELVPPGGTRP